MFDAIVDMLPRVREDNAVGVAYRHHGYNVLNQRLDLTASCVASVGGNSYFPLEMAMVYILVSPAWAFTAIVTVFVSPLPR